MLSCPSGVMQGESAAARSTGGQRPIVCITTGASNLTPKVMLIITSIEPSARRFASVAGGASSAMIVSEGKRERASRRTVPKRPEGIVAAHTPTRSVEAVPLRMSSALCLAHSAIARMRCASARKVSPRGVSAIVRFERLTTAPPSSSSRSLICVLSVDWLMPSNFAARPKCMRSARTTKA